MSKYSQGREEIWKDVVGYEGLYLVSSYGQVFSFPRPSAKGGIILQQENKGYFSLKLCKDKSRKRTVVHKIVADAFLVKPDYYECINHKDGDKHNNFYGNLEYTTFKKNTQHAWDNGLCEKARIAASKRFKGVFGADHITSKPIVQIDRLTGIVIKEFVSATFASQETDICRQHISKCCTGNRKSAGGFFWEHKFKTWI